MSSSQPTPTRLFPLQTRVIHASAGMRLRVVSGRLWLTQPNMAQDLFLGPGSVVDLLQDWVVIGADAEPRPQGGAPEAYSEYQLVSLVPARPRPRILVALQGMWAAMGRRLGALGPALVRRSS
ncbi:DUF2917 domain-containing protein [Hydrogenophaga pseudoflava]|uniref:DUF2917 domain-containing protein n=1 Tax=Hydrogenophaga pseudoflava TaxID=47421 RepID=UPI0027E538FD|nr:DUF2917 domain-containing protein [Hydrogenophaga pseudoflava]MDQ7745704.1 DUF2917 domain-containing protein [Hydrogenophaga pseudoflava]